MSSDLLWKPGGFAAPMARSSEKLGFPVVARELDLENEQVLDIILMGIKMESERGTIIASTRYKGKNPKRWFDQAYPRALNSKIIGAFAGANQLLGWCSFVSLISNLSILSIGMIISPTCRNLGIGKELLRLCCESIGAIITEVNVEGFFIQTTTKNISMINIAKTYNFYSIERNDIPLTHPDGIVYFLKKYQQEEK